ncbi:RNA-binding protein [Halovulum dunhuangense]|uniref:RNA-binding protein n=1 Tax=Halovulum dunhuangense TaxID=1505036 RepID=A0A849KVE7_9RHOB|nr:RNA-binding protein [Halovulum dunhuangense]
MSRGGRKIERDAPERRCIATGETGPKAGLVRFVVGPDDSVVPDLAEKLPGRGIWVSADRAALEKAARKGLFSRAARRAVTAAPDLADRVEALLAARVVELLSLARKAGLALSGLEKVREALVSGEACCLLQASDGSAREKARLRPPAGENTYFAELSAAEMGLAFGRDRVIHAALISGGLAERVRYESARLAGLRRDQGQQDAGQDVPGTAPVER